MPQIRLTFWDLSSIANLLERKPLIYYEPHSYEYPTKFKLGLDHITSSERLLPILNNISTNGYGLSTSLVYGEVPKITQSFPISSSRDPYFTLTHQFRHLSECVNERGVLNDSQYLPLERCVDVIDTVDIGLDKLDKSLALASSASELVDALVAFLGRVEQHKMTIHLHVGTKFSDTTRSHHTITLLAAHYNSPSRMANKLINWKRYENTITISGHTFTTSSQDGPNSQILFTDPKSSATKAGKIEAIAVYRNSPDTQTYLTVRPFTEHTPERQIISSEQLTIIGGKILRNIPCPDVTVIDFRQVLGQFLGHPLNELNEEGNPGYFLALPCCKNLGVESQFDIHRDLSEELGLSDLPALEFC